MFYGATAFPFASVRIAQVRSAPSADPTVDNVLLQKLLHTVALFHMGQPVAAHLMLTHVMEVLDQRDEAHPVLHDLVERLIASLPLYTQERDSTSDYLVC